MSDLVLRELQLGDEAALRAAVEAFLRTNPDWEFAFHFDADTDFAAYVNRLERQRDGFDLPDGWVPSTYLVAVVDGAIVGRVSLRHELNDFLLNVGGHVGYGVVASQRRKGYATEMLRQTLPIARGRGNERLLVTCDEDNLGSIAVIERNGGVFEDARPQELRPVAKLRYWINL